MVFVGWLLGLSHEDSVWDVKASGPERALFPFISPLGSSEHSQGNGEHKQSDVVCYGKQEYGCLTLVRKRTSSQEKFPGNTNA